jgi:hypothetical protein
MNLMLCEFNEDLLEAGPGDTEVKHKWLFKLAGGIWLPCLQVAKPAKQIAEAADGLRIDSFFNLERCLYCTIFLAGIVALSTLHVRHGFPEVVVDLPLFSCVVLEHDSVAFSVGRLQMCWRPVTDEPTIDHDSDIIAKAFGLVHPVRSQHHRTSLEAFKHAEEAAAADWIDSSGWLIKKFNLRVANETHCTN